MIAVVVLVASTLGWIGLEGAVSTSEPHAHLPRELATGLALLAVHVTATVEHLARGLVTPPALLACGAAAIVAGVALRVTAIRALGPQFVSATAKPTRVVRAGPYRFTRHPSELGLVAAAFGAAALLASVAAAIVVAGVLVPLVLVRCAAEDRLWAR